MLYVFVYVPMYYWHTESEGIGKIHLYEVLYLW